MHEILVQTKVEPEAAFASTDNSAMHVYLCLHMREIANAFKT